MTQQLAVVDIPLLLPASPAVSPEVAGCESPLAPPQIQVTSPRFIAEKHAGGPYFHASQRATDLPPG